MTEDEMNEALEQMFRENLLDFHIDERGEISYTLTQEGLEKGEKILGGKDIGEFAAAMAKIVITILRRTWEMEFNVDDQWRIWLYMTIVGAIWRMSALTPWEAIVMEFKRQAEDIK